MKKNIKVYEKGKYVEKEITYIPIRYIVAVLLTVFEMAAIMVIIFLMAIYIPYFYITLIITEVAVVISIIASNDNPDYKIPWLLFTIILPIVGFMLYFMFHERKLPKKIVKRLDHFNNSLEYDDSKNIENLKQENKFIYTQAIQLCNISNTHLYKNTELKYYKIGEEMFNDMLMELQKAQKFIFLEYFIIEEGKFWDSILNILIEKAKMEVEVKLVYDDIGCMCTLSGSYYKRLKKYNIGAIPFSKLKGYNTVYLNL